MKYHAKILGDVDAMDILREIPFPMQGLYAVNSSFDSGLISSNTYLPLPKEQWRENGQYCGRIIDQKMVLSWPESHDKFCDEWWIFDSDPGVIVDSITFCNHMIRLSSYLKGHSDTWPPFRLKKWIRKYQPIAVFGYNAESFLIIRESQLFGSSEPLTRPAGL